MKMGNYEIWKDANNFIFKANINNIALWFTERLQEKYIQNEDMRYYFTKTQLILQEINALNVEYIGLSYDFIHNWFDINQDLVQQHWEQIKQQEEDNMNNNIERFNKQLAYAYQQAVKTACDDPGTKNEIIRGGGNNGGILTRLSMPRPIARIRISEDALQLCLDNGIMPYDYFFLTLTDGENKKMERKYGEKYKQFFRSNKKNIDDAHAIGHYLTGDHNVPNKVLIETMLKLYESNPNASVNEYARILNSQSLDLITLEENKRLDEAGLKSAGTQEERDKYCSPKIELTDFWLTPTDVIDKFFEISGLDRSKCWDPCASDDRWLRGQGYATDILPMKKNVVKKDFLTTTSADLPEGITTIVGNLPFSLLDEFVNKSLELTGDCYFLVNGDTVLQHFPNNIEHIYIFSGLEGNQKDNRSRCEFDVPYLLKSQLWCCIVHITKETQPAWTVQADISNAERRDGYHIALGRNTFIKLDTLVDENPRISRIPVKSNIDYKGGKKLITPTGEKIDLTNFDYLHDGNQIKEQNIKTLKPNDELQTIIYQTLTSTPKPAAEIAATTNISIQKAIAIMKKIPNIKICDLKGRKGYFI